MQTWKYEEQLEEQREEHNKLFFTGAERARELVATRGWDGAYQHYATNNFFPSFDLGFKAYLDLTLEQESAWSAMGPLITATRESRKANWPITSFR